MLESTKTKQHGTDAGKYKDSIMLRGLDWKVRKAGKYKHHTGKYRLESTHRLESTTKAKAAAKYAWSASKYVANKVRKKIVKTISRLVITRFFRYTELNDITDQTLEEVVNELDNFATILKYENSTINDKSSIKATNLY